MRFSAVEGPFRRGDRPVALPALALALLLSLGLPCGWPTAAAAEEPATPPKALASAPFGLEAGAGREQAEAVLGTLQTVEPSVFLSTKVPGDLPHLETLTLVLTPNQGLCRVQAGTELFTTDPAGAEVRSRFAEVRVRLEALYGQANLLDAEAGSPEAESVLLIEAEFSAEPAPDAPTTEPPADPAEGESWVEGLLARRNALLAVWSAAASPLGHNLQSITLSARALKPEEAFLTVDYVYTIWDYCRPVLAGEEEP